MLEQGLIRPHYKVGSGAFASAPPQEGAPLLPRGHNFGYGQKTDFLDKLGRKNLAPNKYFFRNAVQLESV